MSIINERLNTAPFPTDYAEILIETLAIEAANFLHVKDVLHHFRDLDDDQAGEVMRRIAEIACPAALPPTFETAAELLNAAELVIARWEKGDLAEAVRLLSDAVQAAKVA